MADESPPRPSLEHKHSTIPLSPTTIFYPRTLPSPVPWTDQGHSPSIYGPTPQIPFSNVSPLPPFKNPKSPHAPPRPPRPDEIGRYNPGWSAPFPSSQAPPAGSPGSPDRLSLPEEAMSFDAGGSGLGDLGTANATRASSSTFDSEAMDLATFVMLPNPASLHGTRSAGSSPRDAHPTPRSLSLSRSTSAPLSILDFHALLTPATPATSPPSSYPHFTSPFSAEDKGKGRERSPPRASSPSPSTVCPPTPRTRAQVDVLEFGGLMPNLADQQVDLAGWVRRDSARTLALQADRERDKIARIRALRTAPRADSGSTDPVVGDLGLGLRRRSSVLPLEAGPEPQDEAQAKQKLAKAKRREAQVIQIPREERSKEVDGWSNDDDEDREDNVSLRRGRMNFAVVDFAGWLPRLIHFVFPLFVLAHYPATLFLDYNVLYTLAQLAMDPTLPFSTSSINSSDFVSSLGARNIDIPTLRTSTAFWVALGIYGLSTFVWGTVVCLWYELGRGYLSLWEQSGQVRIGKVYTRTAAFNFACMRSFSDFSFLYRIRLAPFQRQSSIRVAGTTYGDGILETCSWYSQNWPTVLLLLPRAGLSLAILLLYGTTAYGVPTSRPMTRDSAYFNKDGTLSSFASAILLANLAWAAYRLLLVLLAAVGLFLFDHGSQNFIPDTPVLPYDTQSPETFYSSKFGGRHRGNYRTRRTRRLRAAILLCATASQRSTPIGFTPRTLQSTTTRKSPARLQKVEREDQRRARLAQRGLATAAPAEKPRSADRLEVVHGESGKPGWHGLAPYVSPSPNVVYSPGRVKLRGEDGTFLPASEHRSPRPPSMSILSEASNETLRAALGADLERRRYRQALKSSFSSATTIPGAEGLGIEHAGVSIEPFSPLTSFTPPLVQLGLESPVAGRIGPTAASNNNESIPLPSPDVPITPQLTDDSSASSPETFVNTPQFTSSSRIVSFPYAYPPTPRIPSPTVGETITFTFPDGAKVDVNEITLPAVPSSEPLARQASQTSQTSLERNEISAKLLSEVQRQHDSDEKVRERERRLAHLSRISEATSREDSGTPQTEKYLSISSEASASSGPFAHASAPRDPSATGNATATPPDVALPPFRLSIISSSIRGSPFELDYPEDDEKDDVFIDAEDAGRWSPSASAASRGSGSERSPTPTSTSLRHIKATRRSNSVYKSPGGDTFGGKGRESYLLSSGPSSTSE